ncbi:AbrB/MazE/SpoVT family DNA-binding domain-containing protein [Candidatus Poribacteria bacterium]|nr:AbrB/MazE/SpoVT family DNA-binding domain-containing protein [Candidatus Poribacteria bacterium]
METRVQKWDNSLALRIPKPLASQIGLEPNSPVELSLRGTELVIAPVTQPCLKLDDLLAQVTENNLHGEVETVDAVLQRVGTLLAREEGT